MTVDAAGFAALVVSQLPEGIWVNNTATGFFYITENLAGVMTLTQKGAAGAGITGGGTANRVARFTAATVLGNAQITDNGVALAVSTGTTLDLTAGTAGTLNAGTTLGLSTTDGNLLATAGGAARSAALTATGAASTAGVSTTDGDASFTAGGAGRTIRVTASDGNVTLTATGAARHALLDAPNATGTVAVNAGAAAAVPAAGVAAISGNSGVTVASGNGNIVLTPGVAKTLTLFGMSFIGSFAFGALPGAPANGSVAYCTDLRVLTAAGPYPNLEAGGLGSGGLVRFSGAPSPAIGWTIMGTAIPASA